MAKESDLLLANQLKTMKKIEIINESEVLKSLNKGVVVSGRLVRKQLPNGMKVTEFIPYNRRKRIRRADKLICELEHGWVKESAERVKVYDSLPKRLGTARITSILEREMSHAKNALMDRELFENEEQQ